MTATTTEIVLAFASGPAAGALGVGIWKIARMVIAARKATRLAEIEAEREDDKRDERTESRLWERLDAIEARSESREKALAEAHNLYVQTVQILGEVKVQLAECQRDRVVQDQRIAALEQRVPADLTGKIKTEVRAEVRRRESVTFPAVRGDKEPEK